MIKIKMGKKEKLFGSVLFVVFFFLIFSVVSAQVMGGEVIQDGSLSPVGQTVFIYGVEKSGNYAEVDVSFDGNKYQFSPEDPWNFLGRAEVLDFVHGYMAGPVEINLSENNGGVFGKEYDIFPQMTLREVLKREDSEKKLFVSENKRFNIDLDIYEGCFLYLQTSNGLKKLCDECNDSSFEFEGEYGENNLSFIVDCDTGIRKKTASKNVDYIDEEIDFNFEKKIKSFGNETYFVSYYGDKSGHQVDIRDFIPKEFEIYGVSSGGRFADYRRGYYEVSWENVYGYDFDFGYFIKPKEWLKNCDYGIFEGDINLRNLKKGEEVLIKDKDFYFDCNFSKEVGVQLVENIGFEREMEEKVRNNEEVEINLSGELSHEVNVELREYVPVSFEIVSVSGDGMIEMSSSNYNVIVWNVSGKDFDVSYNVMPTVSGDYSFASSLGGKSLDEENIMVYDFVPPIRKSKGGGGGYVYKPKNFSKVGPKNPLIEKKGNITAALYSKYVDVDGALGIFGIQPNKIYNRSLKFVEAYSFETNLGNNVGEFAFEYSSSSPNLEFYGTDKEGIRNRITGMSVGMEEGNYSYKYLGDKFFRDISVYFVKSKLSLFDRLIQWFWDLGFVF